MLSVLFLNADGKGECSVLRGRVEAGFKTWYEGGHWISPLKPSG
jgi:hypothetical protein